MEIQELNKKQLILLTLLITFVVSIATGIITVSLMQQMPQSVPATVNNVIQRTIEKINTTPATTPDSSIATKDPGYAVGEGADNVVYVYAQEDKLVSPAEPKTSLLPTKPLGQGVVISDNGLLLVDTTILTDKEVYSVELNKVVYDASIIKKFLNGFTILKISKHTEKEKSPSEVLPSTTSKGNVEPH